MLVEPSDVSVTDWLDVYVPAGGLATGVAAIVPDMPVETPVESVPVTSDAYTGTAETNNAKIRIVYFMVLDA